MLSKDELLKYPNYLLTKYQNQIFRELTQYMEDNNLSQKDIAERLSVSNAYISQILNGNFNFTLKKLIELGLMIGKVPDLNFVEISQYSVYPKYSVQKKDYQFDVPLNSFYPYANLEKMPSLSVIEPEYFMLYGSEENHLELKIA